MSNPMTEREKICRALMGRAAKNWATTFETLTVTQIVHAVDMLKGEGGHSPLDVFWCNQVLVSWGWYKQAGLATKPPWEITDADIQKLVDMAPWNPSGQLPLFEGAV